MKNARGLSPFQNALITFLLGSVTCGWSLIILPHLFASGYMPASSTRSFPILDLVLVDAPFFLALYAASVLSGSISWNGAVIGEKQKSVELFWRYLSILVLGASVTGLACSVFRLATSEVLRTTHMYTGAAFLFGVLASLWSPMGGLLRQK